MGLFYKISILFFLAWLSVPAITVAQKKATEKKEKEKKPVYIYKKKDKKDPYEAAYEETLKLIRGKKDTLIDSSKIIATHTKEAPGKGKDQQKKKHYIQAGEVCHCMGFQAESQDVLERDVYITYKFRLKNNCKEAVWVNTSSFGYRVFNPDGKPTRVLRKLSFVKRYNYPEFVMLPPDSEYEFKFSDDAFFEYDLHRALDYEFRYYFNNTTKKAAMDGLNYLCIKEVRQMVHIK